MQHGRRRRLETARCQPSAVVGVRGTMVCRSSRAPAFRVARATAYDDRLPPSQVTAKLCMQRSGRECLDPQKRWGCTSKGCGCVAEGSVALSRSSGLCNKVVAASTRIARPALAALAPNCDYATAAKSEGVGEDVARLGCRERGTYGGRPAREA